MFCTNCGNKIENEKFCPNCGQQVQQLIDVVDEKKLNENSAPIIVVEDNTKSNEESSTSYNSNEHFSQDYSNKSKIAAGLFGIFLGAFGVHNFYLGFTGKAVAQLLITVLSCGTLAGVSGIWGMVEGIIALTSKDFKDSEGKILKD